MSHKYSTMEQPWWAHDGLVLVLTMFNIGIILYDYAWSVEVFSNLWWSLAICDLALTIWAIADLIEDCKRCLDKKWWWKRHGWEFAGLIPMVAAALPFMRGTSMLRLFRLTRAFTGIFRLIGATQRKKEITVQKQVLHLLMIVAFLIIAGAFFVHIFESEVHEHECKGVEDPPSKCDDVIHNYPTAIWWAIVTTTTVGYGDVSPTTWHARVVASVLMLIGIGLVGTLAATLSQLFYSTRSSEGGEDNPDDDVIFQINRLAEHHRVGSISSEVFEEGLMLARQRLRLELKTLRVEFENINMLPVPLQVASKMQMEQQQKALLERISQIESLAFEEE